MKIVILGPQGSGKGTQGKLLAENLRIPHISTGDISREEAKRNTKLGRKIKSIVEKGNLVPDDIILGLLLKRVKRKECRNGFILDGYPRNKKQLDSIKDKIKFDVAFWLDVSEKESIKRLIARRECKKCKAVYNLLIMKPKKAGLCDKCGSSLVQREDDKPQAIEKRLAIYRKKTRPIFNYFSKKGILVHINGEQDIDKVFSDILKELNKRT